MAFRVLVAAPSGNTERETGTNIARAARQLKQFHYEPVISTNTDGIMLVKSELKGLPPDTHVNQNLLFAAMLLLRASTCQAIYFSLGWETDAPLRLLHTLAQIYGIEVMYEEDPNEEL